jgi:predicted aminopeptidase
VKRFKILPAYCVISAETTAPFDWLLTSFRRILPANHSTHLPIGKSGIRLNAFEEQIAAFVKRLYTQLMKSPPRRWVTMVTMILCSGISGCSTVKFYAQAIHGQGEILRKARSTAAVMGDRKIPGETKRKLALVQDVRSFARTHLELPSNRQYDRYTDLGRRYVSWVVYAAPEFSVDGKTWWYPFLGKLEYRGYFSKQAADDEAARLRGQGYETHVGGVDAYSTLGWFRDPVLNTFLCRSDHELAELLFHELTHVKVFAPGDTDFNEAFATANAEHGVREWLKSKGDADALARYETALKKDREIIRLLLESRQKLKAIYAQKARSPEEMRGEKAAVFARMREGYARIRARWRDDSRYDRTFAKPWNNARLNTVATYYELVPHFERLLKVHGGDLRTFYESVEAMRKMSSDKRRIVLRGGKTDTHPRTLRR